MRRLLAGLAGTVLLAAAGCGSEQGSPHNDVDVAFAQDMVPHHRQALEMVAIAKQKAGLDAEVRDLVAEIGDAQGPEVSTMTGWLRDWDEKVPGNRGDTAMRGMLSASELDELRAADGTAFERLWLQDMVRHHQGAIPMARTEVDGGRNGDAKQLARGIIATQRAEIDQMTGLIGQ